MRPVGGNYMITTSAKCSERGFAQPTVRPGIFRLLALLAHPDRRHRARRERARGHRVYGPARRQGRDHDEVLGARRGTADLHDRDATAHRDRPRRHAQRAHPAPHRSRCRRDIGHLGDRSRRTHARRHRSLPAGKLREGRQRQHADADRQQRYLGIDAGSGFGRSHRPDQDRRGAGRRSLERRFPARQERRRPRRRSASPVRASPPT